MPAETRTVTLEITKRQSDFMFALITMHIRSWLDNEEGVIPNISQDFRDMVAILALLDKDLREDASSNPAMLRIAQAIHQPFCHHDHMENKTDVPTGLYI